MGDLTASGAVADLAARARTHGPLELVVHAAGEFVHGPLEAERAQASHRVVAGHLQTAVALLAETAGDLVPGATVILVGSLAARRAFADNAAYVAAKHGLAGLAQAYFLEARARGVRVSLLSPGFVAAGPTLGMGAGESELARFLSPQDVADAADFILGLPEHVCVSELEVRPVHPSRVE